jgi:hypothetical protein
MEHIFLPLKNKNDLIGKEELAVGINVIWVEHADQVLSKVLEPIKKARR